MNAFQSTPVNDDPTQDLSERFHSIKTTGQMMIFLAVVLSHIHEKINIVIAPSDFEEHTGLGVPDTLVFFEDVDHINCEFTLNKKIAIKLIDHFLTTKDYTPREKITVEEIRTIVNDSDSTTGSFFDFTLVYIPQKNKLLCKINASGRIKYEDCEHELQFELPSFADFLRKFPSKSFKNIQQIRDDLMKCFIWHDNLLDKPVTIENFWDKLK